MKFLSSSFLEFLADTSLDTIATPGNRKNIPIPAAAERIKSYPSNFPTIPPPRDKPNADKMISAITSIQRGMQSE